ncbi:MAG: HAMP domain-containing sensor histidine kinase [Eubacteriales bacterium]|nr:HAMP domain-containing sensor histidine kinase [Eubacteriales bacterium]
MRKLASSLWIRIVAGFFLSMMLTFSVICLVIHAMNVMDVWPLLPLPVTGLHFLVLLAVISTLLGTLVNGFVSHHVLGPILALSRAMQQVSGGNYAVRLDENGHQGEVRGLLEDFNRMAQELNSTQTLHSDFISNVSHEFKTPLAAISGYATLLQDDTLSQEERDEYIRIIISSTKELSRMTGDILSLSRLENQTIITDLEDFRVDEQIRRCILRMEPLWSAKHLVLNPELDEITWKGSQEITSHIWSNLLDNAVKFTPTGGEISVSASMDDRWLTVAVSDTGIGMTPEVQARIFDKFYQGDTSHEKKGSGLGLALVHKIVALYGGSIEVESFPDLGSRFTVRLPADVSASGQPSSHS